MENITAGTPGFSVHSSVVIGGVNVDIWGSPSSSLRLHDSNPGSVKMKAGGVGRNIAHNLSLLGMKTSMLTAFGDDVYAGFARSSCKSAGIDVSLSEDFEGAGSSVYLYITDETGDMLAAISDMDIVSRITPEVLRGKISAVNSFGCAVLDANLTQESIQYLAGNCTVPLFADPVSTAKALRLIPALGRLEAIKPNAIEALALTGEDSVEKAARSLVRAGVKRVFVSLGGDGILAADRESLIRVPAEKITPVNTTGAGDAATAAIVYASLRGMTLEQSALLAAKAGAATALSVETNCPGLSEILRCR